MTGVIESLARRVQDAHKISMQGSYERRAPSAKSHSIFVTLRRELRAHVVVQPSAEAWKLLASVEEGLMAYPSALASLESALALGLARDQKTLKWLARLRENAKTWRTLSLNPNDLAALGRHLEGELAERGCDHTTGITQAWLKKEQPGKARQILNGLQEWGGFCDCEILANAVGN